MTDKPKAGSEIKCSSHNIEGCCASRCRDERREQEIAALRAEVSELRATHMRDMCAINHEPIRWSPEEDFGRCPVCALRAELAAIKAQAEDATEYVLAVENRELRAELAQAKEEMSKLNAKWGDGSSWIPEAVLRAERASKLDEIRVRDAVVSEYAATTAGLREDLHREATDNVKLYAELAAEKAARSRAEARVKEDETLIAALMTGCRNDRGRCTICNHDGLVVHGHYSGCAVLLAFSVLAARRSEPAKAEEES